MGKVSNDREPSKALRNGVEALIDLHGLHNLLAAAAEVCRLKSEHTASAWQDRTLAKLWERAATCLDMSSAAIPYELP
jgi:hypothetical protein